MGISLLHVCCIIWLNASRKKSNTSQPQLFVKKVFIFEKVSIFFKTSLFDFKKDLWHFSGCWIYIVCPPPPPMFYLWNIWKYCSSYSKVSVTFFWHFAKDFCYFCVRPIYRPIFLAKWFLLLQVLLHSKSYASIFNSRSSEAVLSLRWSGRVLISRTHRAVTYIRIRRRNAIRMRT